MDETHKIRILFVCWGNICRSPMAEFIMKDMVKRAGLEERFEIASAATSDEEIRGDGTGNPVYPPAKRILAAHGLDCGNKRARQMTREDYGRWDLLIGMEEMNLRYMKRIAGGDPENKIRRLLDYSERPRDIADPWYSGDFEATWRDITEGCAALLDALRK
ncbi:MAG: low molecular weight phosphotyrosine protein phosphatase [Clostridia bacterium]|nr:low molecular weight phosphotyrosine protein phosphatase [Clostridia bacterium]MBQ3859946.1 low molecular weight phosphotyrosine protein phosphatase [Clostridia bacterium]